MIWTKTEAETGFIGVQYGQSDTPLRSILQSRTARNGLYHAWLNISSHLFCEKILSKKVKKICKSVAGVFFKHADMRREKKYWKHVQAAGE